MVVGRLKVLRRPCGRSGSRGGSTTSPGMAGREKGFSMANTSSAKKATRKIAARTEVNKARRSRMRSFVRKFEEAVASGDKTAATEAFKAVEPEIMRAATKGIVHKNTASRKVSRLAARLKSIGV